MTYCEYIKTIDGELLALHKDYHDNHYGFPLEDDNLLFERLMLEINQAGLSWILILKKSKAFHKAFDGFDLKTVAAYGENDIKRLLDDEGIIRNGMKIKAAIENAKRVIRIVEEHGSFKKWLDLNAKTHNDLQAWTRLFKKTFFFMGPEIVNEFLMSTGYLPGAHSPDCEAYKRIEELKKKQ